MFIEVRIECSDSENEWEEGRVEFRKALIRIDEIQAFYSSCEVGKSIIEMKNGSGFVVKGTVDQIYNKVEQKRDPRFKPNKSDIKVTI